MRVKGFTLIELLIVIAVIGILALIVIPNYTGLRVTGRNSQAESAGNLARVAQEAYYQNQPGPAGSTYSDSLQNLLRYDKNLTSDAGVTFIFGACNTSGYIYTTSNKYGDKTYVFQ